MKRFLLKAAGFLLLQVLILIPFWNSDLPGEHNYFAGTIDKHKRLRATPAPRLILVGGSNLAFGIKSDQIERELGLPLVNMALAMPLGVQFMLDEVEGDIARGDIVLLSLEYEVPEVGHSGMLAELVEFRPANLALFPRARQKHILDTQGLTILGGLARRMLIRPLDSGSEDEGYKRELFDVQGSYTGHYGKRPRFATFPKREYVGITREASARIGKFARACRNRGASVLYSFPAHPAELLEPVPSIVQANMMALKAIPGIQVLDTPQDHAYPSDLFFDTAYHLTDRGASQRTAKLIQELRPFVKEARLASRN